MDIVTHVKTGEAPVSAEEAKREVARLLDGNALPKTGVDVGVFFPIVERHFKDAIDAEMVLPYETSLYLYMSDEGFLIVLTVLYGFFRGACRSVSASITAEGEYVTLSYLGKTEAEADASQSTRPVAEELWSTLCAIAKAAGFGLALCFGEGTLEMRFSFARFRALPVSAYSCSEEFVRDKMDRAMRLFMSGSTPFDI